jgi:ribosomal-protein-alanine N-acetyltransferase
MCPTTSGATRVTPRDLATTLAIARLRDATFANQREWVRRIGSIDANGHSRAVHEGDGILAVRTGPTGAIMLPDRPEISPSALTTALDWLRHAGTADVLIWSITPQRSLDRILSAHGACDHFTPQWMTRRTSDPLPDAPEPAATVRLATPDDLSGMLAARDLPYHSPWQVRSSLHLTTSPATRADVAVVIAITSGDIVGRGVMSISSSHGLRTAGVYDVGVSPASQRRGIGRAMMRAMLDVARGRDADLLTLNATPAGERLYRSLGFEDAGGGQTWLLPADTLRFPPEDDRVRLAMLISGGDDPGPLKYLAGHLLPNGDTPLAHAARFEQVEMARQLVEMGTIPDIAALWELGLEDEALEAMANPKALDARRGRQRSTPLHIAIYWDDLDLLEALLDAGADPRIRDGEFDSDAWGWCHALGRIDALGMLNEYRGRRE